MQFLFSWYFMFKLNLLLMIYNPHFGFMDFLMIFKKQKILSRYYVYLIFTWKNFMFICKMFVFLRLALHFCMVWFLIRDGDPSSLAASPITDISNSHRSQIYRILDVNERNTHAHTVVLIKIFNFCKFYKKLGNVLWVIILGPHSFS